MDTPRTIGQRVLLLIGSIGPLGYAPASGTVAVAVAGIPLFLLMHRLPLLWYLAGTVLLTALSIWVHDRGDRILGEKDSRKLVLDELVGFAVAMTAVPAAWQCILLGLCWSAGSTSPRSHRPTSSKTRCLEAGAWSATT